MLVDAIGRLVRPLRWAAQRWSSQSDRVFHDHLYAAQRYDPFTPSFAGYITIRRFADHAAVFIQPSFRRIVDIGCGPGEITCELARRHPQIEFSGYDHSSAAIERARSHANRLGLSNVAFEARDAIDAMSGEYDCALLFDAFHHITDPAAFVAALRRHTSRAFMVEPAGRWHGGWQRDLDFDWIATEIDKLGARFAHAIGCSGPPGTAGAAPAIGGEAVERRYAFADFDRFFAGFTLHVRGTVAGLERCPPDPYARSEVRDRFGEIAYELFREADERLFAEGRDFAAKHWCIYASLVDGTPRRPTAVSPAGDRGGTVTGAFDVAWLRYDGPSEARAGQELLATVELSNRGWQTWRSDLEPAAVKLSYHWLDANSAVLSEGGRTALPRPVGPGDTCVAALRVRTPSAAGRYRLAIDLVQEGVTWFGAAGSPPLVTPFRIRR